MVMPNFLVIGAPRCASTSLHYYLRQHPEIYMSEVKEPGFLALEGRDIRVPRGWKSRAYTVFNLEEYQVLFRKVTDEKAIGESSVNYFLTEGVIPRIKKYVPRAKLVVLLRNPADRAYSGYLLGVRNGVEKLSFEEAIGAEDGEPVTDLKWQYRERRFVRAGFYSIHLKRFFDSFPVDQLGIFFFDDLQADPLEWVRRIYSFLGVDPGFQPDLTRLNPSRLPRSHRLASFQRYPNPLKSVVRTVTPQSFRSLVSRKLFRFNLDSPPPQPRQTRARLIEIYREDILRLQHMVDRDLSHWLRLDS